MTWWQKRGCEQVPHEMGVGSKRDMLPGTWLQGSQAKASLSGDIRSHRKVVVEEVLGGIATFRWHGEVSDRPGKRSDSFSEGVLNIIRVSDAGPIRPL